MKHCVTWLVMATAISLTTPALAEKSVTFQLDESAPVEYDVTNTPVDEDPNADEFKAPTVEKARPVATAKPKQPATPAKPKPQPPRDIPLIETQNEATSSDDITFVTGGIGEEEKEAIEASKADYNLHIVNTSVDGSYVGDVRVQLVQMDKTGPIEKLNVVSGPLLNVRVPVGAYTLKATLGTQTKSQELTVSKKAKAHNVQLVWKTGAN